MRLIDADAFAEMMKQFSENDTFKEDCRKAYKSVYLMLTVDKQKYSPTAYDVDKVVEQLEEERDKCEHGGEDDYLDGKYDGIDKTIDIIRAGGKE